MRDKTIAVRSELEEYRVSVYLYAFSTYVDVMLHGNFEEDYLAALVEKDEDESIGYRQLYTQAYDLIEASSSDVRPFIDNIENVSRLYNEPVMLMADEEAAYILPGGAASLETSEA